MKCSNLQYSEYHHGNLSPSLDEAKVVLQRRRNFLGEHNVDWEKHICMRCTHGTDITVVDSTTRADELRMIETEVLITQEPGLTLMVFTADCLPVTYFDPQTKTLALAHQSRHTIAKGLPAKLIEKLVTEFSVDPAHLVVQTGPFIHSQSYSFPLPQPPLPERMQPYTNIENERVYIDIAAAHSAPLIAAGMRPDNIHYNKIDTAVDENYFSYYNAQQKNAPDGRFATIASF